MKDFALNLDASAAIRRRNHVLWVCDAYLYLFGGLGLLADPRKHGLDAFIVHGDVWRTRIGMNDEEDPQFWELVPCFGNLPCPRDDFGHCGEHLISHLAWALHVD